MNIEYEGKQDLTSYRKIAIASWRHPRNPTIYTSLDLPMAPAMAFMESFASEHPITLTHFVTKIIAECLRKYPPLNHVLRKGNLYKRKNIDIFISTLIKTEKGNDLSGYLVHNTDKTSIQQVGDIMKARTQDLRLNQDEAHLTVQKLVNPLSTCVIKPLLLIQEFFQYTLNLTCPKLGMTQDRFGSAMITNIGALGIDNAYIPLSPYCRCPLFLCIGKVRKAPMVEGDQVVVGEMVTISFTADHRHVDGAHVSHMIRRFKKIFTDPESFRSVFEGDQPPIT